LLADTDFDGLNDYAEINTHHTDPFNTDTDGDTKFCYNSALATCRVRLSGSRIAATELVASRRAMFEILTATRNADVPLLA